MSAHAPAVARRIPSLDGLRAISIAFVLYSHWGLTATVPFLGALPQGQFGYWGQLGVSVFFVISGFLITTLLAGEKEKTAKVDLPKFYIRRMLRIFPAYYAYLFAIFVLAATGFVSVSHRDLLISALYLRDYSAQTTPWTNHTWSLAVEEQFYLLWPFLVFLLRKRQLVVVCVAVIVASPFLRVLTYVLAPGLRDIISVMFQTRGDSLMFGCLLALIRFDSTALRARDLFARMHGPLLATLVLVVLSPLLYARFQGAYLFTIGYTLDGICIVLLLAWAVEHPDAWAGRVLNWRPVAAIGTLSYSLYLWHVVFIGPLHGTMIPFPLNVVLTFAAAWCSFRFIEVPFNGLRRRFGSAAVAVEPSPLPVQAVTTNS